MSLAFLLIAGVVSADLTAEVTRLDGSIQSGVVVSADAESITLAAEDGQTIGSSEIRNVLFTAVLEPDEFAEPPPIEVWLTNGSRLACTSLVSDRDEFSMDVESLGTLVLPRFAVRAIRLAPVDRLSTRWLELLDRENNADLIVVRRQDSLDFVECSVGEFTNEAISVFIEKQDRTLPRDRTFGVILARPMNSPVRPPMTLHWGRSLLHANAIQLDPDSAHVTMTSNIERDLDPTHLRKIEFSGRVRLLSDLKPVIELPQGVAADESFRYFRYGSEPFGAPLKIGADEFITSEGLWIHSGVTVRYRINRDFRRLAAIAGMDHNVVGDRSVRLIISGDEKALFDDIIRWKNDTVDLDLDVSGVRDLVITVARLPENIESNIFGIQEHLDLGNIRLIR